MASLKENMPEIQIKETKIEQKKDMNMWECTGCKVQQISDWCRQCGGQRVNKEPVKPGMAQAYRAPRPTIPVAYRR